MATNKQIVLKIKLFKFSCEYTCQWVLAELIVSSMCVRLIRVCVCLMHSSSRVSTQNFLGL